MDANFEAGFFERALKEQRFIRIVFGDEDLAGFQIAEHTYADY